MTPKLSLNAILFENFGTTKYTSCPDDMSKYQSKYPKAPIKPIKLKILIA